MFDECLVSFHKTDSPSQRQNLVSTSHLQLLQHWRQTRIGTTRLIAGFGRICPLLGESTLLGQAGWQERPLHSECAVDAIELCLRKIVLISQFGIILKRD